MTNAHPDTEAFAARLTGRQVGEEITYAEAHEARAAGLVIVYGASDDLMEFDGAIVAELSCYGGGTARVDADGLIRNITADDIDDELDADAAVAYFTRRKNASIIKALWCEGSTGWCYETDIPHATFRIVEGDEYYCDGIVFRLVDAAQRPASTSFVLTEDLLRRVRARDRLSPETVIATEVVLDHAGEAIRPGVYVRAATRWVLDHRRDPDADCDEYEPGPAAGDCQTDGHYMCEGCKQRDPEHEWEIWR